MHPNHTVANHAMGGSSTGDFFYSLWNLVLLVVPEPVVLDQLKI